MGARGNESPLPLPAEPSCNTPSKVALILTSFCLCHLASSQERKKTCRNVRNCYAVWNSSLGTLADITSCNSLSSLERWSDLCHFWDETSKVLRTTSPTSYYESGIKGRCQTTSPMVQTSSNGPQPHLFARAGRFSCLGLEMAVNWETKACGWNTQGSDSSYCWAPGCASQEQEH
jgi:hypothetical protein